MIRARERGMSYWPFVITLVALLVMTYMWYEADKVQDDQKSNLRNATAKLTAETDRAREFDEALDLLRNEFGFNHDSLPRPDSAKARARILEFVQQTGEQLSFEADTNKFSATGQGGRVEQLNDGKIRVAYFPPAAELAGESLTLEGLFPLFVDAVKRMQADIQNQIALRAATDAEKGTMVTAHAGELSTKDQAISERQSQIQALQANLAQQGSELREQISTLEAQVDSARTELEEFRTQSEGQIAQLENKVAQGQGEVKTLIGREKPYASEGPDGEVLAARDGTAWVNLGKRNLLMPGTTFTVLGRQKGGRLYAKGVVRITMVDETMSRAAVMELTSRADPIVEGDLVQSAAYSKNRQMRFFLLGEFRAMGKSMIESRLESIGAKVDDEVSTLTHYLVLGSPGPGGENLEATAAYKKAMQYGTTILTEAQLASFTSR